MRIIARTTALAYAERHPTTRPALVHWLNQAKAADWATSNDVQAAFPKAKVLNAERVRFPIAGGDHRLVVAFDFARRIAFIKFLGTHAEYDRVDALTVSLF